MSTNGTSKDSPRPFVLEERPEGKTLVVTGKWTDETAAALEQSDVSGLELNYARGFREKDLSFIDHWPVRRLLVLDRRLADLSPLLRLQSLEELRLDTERGATLDVAAFPSLTAIAAEWPQIQDTAPHAIGLRGLSLWLYDGTDLTELAGVSQVEDLELYEPAHLQSLAGVKEFHSLGGLHVFLAPNLKDIAPIKTATRLSEFELEGCARVGSLDPLTGLEDLRFVSVSDCGTIESFKPLGRLHRLEELHAWGTTVVADGDLTPVAQLPMLREVRMRNRRHYRPRVADLPQG